jgi:hypothetical protein
MVPFANADNVAYEFNYIFTSGFITALIGITPPGLLNMTAKVNLKEGKKMPLGSYSVQ